MDFAKFVQIPKSVRGETAKNDYESILNSPSTTSDSSHKPLRRIKQRQRKYNQAHANVTFSTRIFFRAAMTDDVAVLKSINFIGNNINSIDQYGWSALMMATCEGSLNAVHFLLNQQADTTVCDRKGNTAETLAASRKSPEILQLIRDKLRGQPNLPIHNKIETVTLKCEEFFCETCNRTFIDTTRKGHESSTLHRFNSKNTYNFAKRYHIPDSNVGFKLMLKQGWDREAGLGPIDNIGISYPVKTTIRKNRSGLGVKQDSAKITHFSAFDRDAIKWRQPAPKPKTHRDFERDVQRNRQKEIAIRKALS